MPKTFPEYPNLFVMDHPLIQHKLSMMRDKNTPTILFRQLLKEIALLMGYEITRNLPMTTTPIETPLTRFDAPILLGKKAAGPDANCHIVKTWPKADITKLMKRTHVEWPWGNTTCNIDVKLKRSVLVAAVTEPKYQAQFDEHQLACDIAREGEAPYSFKIAMTPNLTFENGKAKEGYITWGALEAPSVAKSVLWSATALDNKVNVLGSEVVTTVNELIDNKCLEVKDQLKLD